jgi:hypothetical protein
MARLFACGMVGAGHAGEPAGVRVRMVRVRMGPGARLAGNLSHRRGVEQSARQKEPDR